MNDNVEIIRSNKGGLKLIHRGYMYTVHKKRQGGGIRWRCTQRSLHCKGSISTGNGPPTVNMPHNHIPDPHSVALARCRQIEEFPDIASMIETEYEDVKDTMPLQQRMLCAPQVHIPTTSEAALQSQPLSPTKLKVTRQSNKPFGSKTLCESISSPPPEEVCLRWNSHHSNMQNSFPKLLETEQYVDVTLISDGKMLKCHRMILSSCSAYFEEILNGITPLQHPVIILKGIPFWILKALIDFMYAGEVNIDQNKLPELLDVAELLKIKGLAGKSNDPEQHVKQENNMIDTNSKHSSKNNSHVPHVITKVEDMPISDPLELLQPKTLDDGSGISLKFKDKLLPRKMFTKKIRKRKSSESECSSPPMFPMRRGTRSRPNVKVPRYYDYEDIVKPTMSDSQPFSPVVTIKSEPADVEDTDGAYSANGDSSINSQTDFANTFSKLSESNSISIKPKLMEKTTSKPDGVSATKEKQTKSDEMKPEQMYKIKIKCLASLSENSTCESSCNSQNTKEVEKESLDTSAKFLDPLALDSDDKNNDILNALEIIKIDVNVHNKQKSLEKKSVQPDTLTNVASPIEFNVNSDKSLDILDNECELEKK